MTLLQTLLRSTAYRTPLLRTLVPTLALSYGIQGAVAAPSIAGQTERFYDLSGSLTYISCTALSLALPFLRARAASNGALTLGEYLSAPAPGQGGWWWRHAVLSLAVGVWAGRLGSFLFKRISEDKSDSRFDNIRVSPPKFLVAFFAQATWVSLCLLPVISLNSLPRSAFAVSRLTTSLTTPVSAKPYWTDVLGLAMFVFGLAFEATADREKSQWSKEKREKKHSEEFLTRGLWSKSRHPNYFGEITLWSGIAIAAGGLLVKNSAQVGLGLGGIGGKVLVASMCAASPAFVAFLLLKVSGIPMSEGKYDKKFGDRKDYQRWKEETPMLVPKLW
ncbi:DUF1295-domain-containing protein [Amniculicola lignicola CBS 123094]|uniref:DUF1295-domain-containing protein n=1 Tax=Amniculicola lignicola CBS 123094 TaxID=1392246 RepID=A0A6A5WR99_9PLEO|nr:DUF1295-domain-containing protein [Amniculicola lignicola CBS 123094]